VLYRYDKCRCRALMEQMSVSGIQRQTLDSLQEKLNDLETTLSRERDEHERAIVSSYCLFIYFSRKMGWAKKEMKEPGWARS